MRTRREFLLSLGAVAAASRRAIALPFRRAKSTPSPMYRVYFGTDTSKGEARGIYRATFDTRTGQLTQMVVAAATEQPSFLALGPAVGTRRMLYAVGEAGDGSVSSFVVDPRTGDLQRVGQVSSGTAGPCYVSVDATGHAAFTANYAGGGVSSYRVQADGTLSAPVDQVKYKEEGARFGENGPMAARQNGPHPHSATISPDNRFLVVCDLGHDRISIFAIDPATATMTTSEPHLFSNNRPGSGPRHVVFHPNQRWVYGINELDDSVDHYLWTATHGEHGQGLLTLAGPPVKTIAIDYPGNKNTAAEVAIAPNGYFLYASNRGENSLVVFTINQDTGALTELQRISCGGKMPRHFAIDPTGNWLLCGNQEAGGVTVFRRDGGSGQLSGPVASLPVPGPMFTLFV